MVIDCHYHLEERVFSEDALLREMDACAVEKNALMGSMVGPFQEPPRFLISVLQLLMENSITRPLAKAFVSNFTDRGEIKILGRPYFITPDPDNRKVFDAVARHPDRFLGWVFVNPRGRNDPVAELEKYKDSPGFIGVKAHPFWHRFRPVELVEVAQRLAALGKPMLLHVGFGEEGDYEALLARVPDLKLILAHAGFPEYRDTWVRIKNLSNVYLDLSQTSYTSERSTREAVSYLGPDRLLFGTDGPYGFHRPDGTYDYGFIKRRIDRLFPDRVLRDKLLGGNFARLVGLV